MKIAHALEFLSLVAFASSAPVLGGSKFAARAANPNHPQEHSHDNFITSVRASLQKNNPLKLGDPVVALLGDQNASGGLSADFTDVLCLQQAIADQAFTNAKAANDQNGTIDALIYRTLQRNGKNNGASGACESVKAVNPEIAALVQHQDPNSPNALAVNNNATLRLAVQIAKVGGDPQLAIKSGTFKPGLVDAQGNSLTCDGVGTPNANGLQSFDPNGCIFTLNLLNPDATAQEISDAVANGGAGGTVKRTV